MVNCTKKTSVKIITNTLLIFAVLISTILQAANITVTTSANPALLDTSFRLIYEADSSVDDDPDFSPIYQHFDVLSSSQSTNMRSVNGNWSLKKSWALTMIAKDVGNFTIPAINFGNDISPAIKITVTGAAAPNTASPHNQATIPAKIFLESSLDKQTGWVQSQFIYTVRLLRTVSIASASITDPVISDTDAIVEKISEDNYQTTRNGVRYEVFERRYAIFPQKSGPLKINPVTFEGRVNPSQARTIFDQFRISGQLKRLRSTAVTATVKAAPDHINLQDWLPAEELLLIEEWSDDITNIKAGDPVTRTITLAARGLTAVQLPALKFAEIVGLKQYPDKPVTENRTETNGITGIKQIKIALIPTTAGDYRLPEINLKWWNTITNKEETATIPATIITAVGTPTTVATLPPIQTADFQQQQNFTDAEKPTITQAISSDYWKWATLAFALAWLLTLILLYNKSSRQNRPVKTVKKDNTASLKTLSHNVEKSAKNNQIENTRSALIAWAKIFYAEPAMSNLSQIMERCSTQLEQSIRELNEALYSPEKPTWDGSKLLPVFNQEQSLYKTRPDKEKTALKPLYTN